MSAAVSGSKRAGWDDESQQAAADGEGPADLDDVGGWVCLTDD